MSEPKEEAQAKAEETTEENTKFRFLRSILWESLRPKPEVPIYDKSLMDENLIDWINDLDKYFEYEEVKENKKAKFAIT